MKNEIKSVVITLLMTIIGFIAGMFTMEALLITDKKALNMTVESHNKWIKS